MLKNSKKGFTLIELLVVIAIIGILSSIVLASLNSARSKGSDAAIKANLANIRTQAEIVYDNTNPNSYVNVCADPTFLAGLTAAANALGGTVVSVLTTAGTASTVICHETATAWAAASPLKSNSANSWCVDNSGDAKQETGYLGASVTACP